MYGKNSPSTEEAVDSFILSEKNMTHTAPQDMNAA